jgi:hypothetical protein
MSHLSRFQLNPHARRPLSAVSLMLVILLVLAACGSEPEGEVPEDRQFANDPAPTRDETMVPTDVPTEAPASETQAPRSATPAALLRTRGAPSTLYTVSGEDLVALTITKNRADEQVIDLPAGAEVLGLDASPTGDRVGVLMRSPGSGTPVVQFFGANGSSIGGPFAPEASGTPAASPAASPVASPGATPEAAGEDHATSVSWVPQGNGVLVVYDNRVVSVDIEDGPREVEMPRVEGTILSAAVSPKGDQVLAQVALDDGAETAFLVEQSTGDVYELWALRTDQGVGISELDWLPSGNGVIFVEGEVIDGVVMRGELFRYLFQDEMPRLVATSGQGGPSATITNVAITPDGFSVAYDVSILDVDQWTAHSLWVRSLKEDIPGIQVPVDRGRPVTDLAWCREGLLWVQASRSGDEPMSLNLVTPSGETTSLNDAGTPQASPVASPVTASTPAATPITTPQATPVDQVTPVG